MANPWSTGSTAARSQSPEELRPGPAGQTQTRVISFAFDLTRSAPTCPEPSPMCRAISAPRSSRWRCVRSRLCRVYRRFIGTRMRTCKLSRCNAEVAYRKRYCGADHKRQAKLDSQAENWSANGDRYNGNRRQAEDGSCLYVGKHRGVHPAGRFAARARKLWWSEVARAEYVEVPAGRNAIGQSVPRSSRRWG
jgi:hypothetical protein